MSLQAIRRELARLATVELQRGGRSGVAYVENVGIDLPAAAPGGPGVLLVHRPMTVDEWERMLREEVSLFAEMQEADEANQC